jgi:hypothetical protein
MEYERYHLVFEGFLGELNRTEISLALKAECTFQTPKWPI